MEYVVGLYLKSKNWNIYFSKGSRGPSDVIAIKNNKFFLIQIKSTTRIPKIRGYEIVNLVNLSKKIKNSFPILCLVTPTVSTNTDPNSIIMGDYVINFYLLPNWKSLSI
jgi:Holliday junction resolvase